MVEALTTYLGLAVASVALFYWWKYTSGWAAAAKLRKLPGPKGWPVIGNCMELRGKDSMHETLRKWALQYGPVFRFRVFNHDVVIINTLEGIHEAFAERGYDFAGRLKFQDFLLTRPPGKSLTIQNPCPLWKTMRRDVHRALKMYSHGLSDFESNMMFVLDELINTLKKEAVGKDFDFHDHLHLTLASFICTLIAGRHCSRSEPMTRMTGEQDVLCRLAASKGGFLLLNAFPWMRHFENATLRTIREGRKKGDIYWSEYVQPLKSTKAYEAGRGLFAEFQKMKEEIRAGDGSNEPLLCDNDVRALVDTMIHAGIVTTMSTVYSLVNILVHHPRVQSRMAEEVASVAGSVSVGHKESLPYTRAVVLELLRYSTVAPLSAPHVTTKDTQVLGYEIPEGTTVMMNLWHLHHDEEHWDKPWTFSPERFLTESGGLVKADHPNRRRVLAFGTGTRACIGEAMAMNRVFLFAANLVKHFQFLPPEDANELSSCDPRTYPPVSVIQPSRFKMTLVERKTSIATM